MPEDAVDAEEKREALFAAVAVELDRVRPDELERAQQRRAELARAGQNLRLGEILLAEGLLDRDHTLEILREARLRAGEAPKLPGYAVERLIGHGATGPVFLARQRSLDRPVALRVFSRRMSRDPALMAAVEKSARAVARLNHPHLVAGIEYGEGGGYPYFAMEYVDGESLAGRLQRERRLSESVAFAAARQAADGLACAAQNGLCHGALRPSALMFDRGGALKIADLGRFLAPGQPTAPHRAPEARALAVDDPAVATVAGDQYSLGAILYEAMSGQPWKPRTAADPDPTPLHQLDLGVGRGASAVVAMLTRHRPEERYPDWPAVLEDLRLLAENRLPRHAHPAKVFREEAALSAPRAGDARIRAIQKPSSGGSLDAALLFGALAAFAVLVLYFGAKGGFTGPPSSPAAFVPSGPDAPAARARALWFEAQASRRAWEKAGGEVGGGGGGQESRGAMASAFGKLSGVEFSELAYGRAARRQMAELGLGGAAAGGVAGGEGEGGTGG